MKQMTKDEMLKLYFRIINDIINIDWDFTKQNDNIQYAKSMARKELLEEILGVKDDSPLPIKISGEEVVL
jgi:hypothetical protein|tara:strand:+ start:104 stop:313 length:210 start_codon:yes stop_codon:yes gene_type:complete